MITILGAGGAVGDELVKELIARGEPIRLVSRNPKPVAGVAETVAARGPGSSSSITYICTERWRA